MEHFSSYLDQIILFVLGLILIFTNAYFKTKGSNQAHKEDKKEITKIIKEVEHKFNENLEIVKSKLDNTNSILKELNYNEKEIILSIFNETFLYYNFLVDLSFGGIDLQNNTNIDDTIELDTRKFNDLFIKHRNLKIFIPEDNYDIIYKFELCMDNFIKFRSTRRNILHELYSLNTVHPKNYSHEKTKLHTQYYKDVNNLITNVHPLLEDFTDEIRKYVKSKSLS